MENGNKLAIIMNGDEEDRFAWSGVNYFIIHSLKKYFAVKYFRATPHYSILSKMIIKVDKMFHKNAKEYPNIVNRLLYRKSIRDARKYSKNILTTISTYAAYTKKSIYVIDAVYKSLLNYYYFNVNKTDIKRLNLIQQKALAKSKKIIFASDWAYKSALKYYRFNKSNSYVNLMGANLEEFNSVTKNVSNKKTIEFLFMGADYERKGLTKIIDLVNLLNKNDKNHKYVLNVVGKQSNSTETIKYFGFLRKTCKEDLKEYVNLYRQSDLFISLPKAECFGIVYCEASMFSLPSISLDTGGISSYLRNNENGLLFKQSDSLEYISGEITKLINDDSRYQKLSKKSRELYENYYNWDKWAEKIASIIND